MVRSPSGAVVAAPPTTTVWRVTGRRLGAALSAARSPALTQVLEPAELEHAARFERSTDRDAYVARHLLVRGVLARTLGVAPADLRLARSPCRACRAPHGRPEVVWPPTDCCFSVAGADAVVLIAVADGPVGVDVEAVPSAATVEQVRRLLHADEQDELALLEPHRLPAALTQVWTRKEAFLKAVGVGLAGGCSAPYVGERAEAHPTGWSIRDLDVGGQHRAALSTPQPGRAVVRDDLCPTV